MENPLELETEELRRFREEWRQEVEGRLEHERVPATTSPTTDINTNSPSENNNESRMVRMGTRVRSHAALELYTQAVKLEADGEHDTATALYRRAFRLQVDVDKVYYRSNMGADLKIRNLSRDVDALSLAQRAPVAKGMCSHTRK